jgi:hypothetical protein
MTIENDRGAGPGHPSIPAQLAIYQSRTVKFATSSLSGLGRTIQGSGLSRVSLQQNITTAGGLKRLNLNTCYADRGGPEPGRRST